MAWTMVSWCDRETYMSGSCLAVGYVRVDPPHQIVVQIVIPISVFAGWERVATTNRPPRCSGLRGARRRRAMPTRCPRSTGWPRQTTKGNKVPPLVSELGDTTLTCFRPRHTLSTSDLPCNYPILPIHAHRDHGLTADRCCRHSRTPT